MLALLAVVTVAEIGLRVLGWWILTSRRHAVERDLGPASDAIRLLHIGESTTFGLGVEPAQAYPAVVARLLETAYPGRRFVSFNRGVPGITTTSIVRTFHDKLIVIRPNLVTILAGVNDYNEGLNGIDSFHDIGQHAPLYALISDLRLFKVARLAIDLRRPDVTRRDGETIFYRGTDVKYLPKQIPRDEAKIAVVTARLEANLRQLLALCREAGVPAVLVGYMRSENENGILEKIAEEVGVPYVSTALSPPDDRPKLFTDDGWHPSALGHRYMAERVAAVIDPILMRQGGG